jgi:hypothetical protein
MARDGAAIRTSASRRFTPSCLEGKEGMQSRVDPVATAAAGTAQLWLFDIVKRKTRRVPDAAQHHRAAAWPVSMRHVIPMMVRR